MSDRVDFVIYPPEITTVKIHQVHLGFDPVLLMEFVGNDNDGVTVKVTTSKVAENKEDITEILEIILDFLKDGKEVGEQ